MAWPMIATAPEVIDAPAAIPGADMVARIWLANGAVVGIVGGIDAVDIGGVAETLGGTAPGTVTEVAGEGVAGVTLDVTPVVDDGAGAAAGTTGAGGGIY